MVGGVELQEEELCSVQMEGFKEGGSDSSLSRNGFRVRFESAQTKQK